MDVRQKQLRCLVFQLACVFAHVISIVVLLLADMAKRIMKVCFISILSFVALFFTPSVAFACSCERPPFGKTEKQLIKLEREKSRTVFAGEITDIILEQTIPGEDAPVAEVRFKVLQSWKGTATKTVTVFTANICCICGYEGFKVGERYLVYTYGSDEDEKLWTGMCTRTKPLTEAALDLRVLDKGKVPKG